MSAQHDDGPARMWLGGVVIACRAAIADIVTTTIIVAVVVAATDTMVLAVLILFDLLLILLDSFPLGRHRPPPGCSALGPPACHRSRRSRPPSSYGSSWAWLLLAQPHPAPRTAPYSAPCADRGAAAFFKPTRLSAAAGGGGSTAEEAKRRAEPAGAAAATLCLQHPSRGTTTCSFPFAPGEKFYPTKTLSVGRPAAQSGICQSPSSLCSRCVLPAPRPPAVPQLSLRRCEAWPSVHVNRPMGNSDRHNVESQMYARKASSAIMQASSGSCKKSFIEF